MEKATEEQRNSDRLINTRKMGHQFSPMHHILEPLIRSGFLNKWVRESAPVTI